jgi:hypothetical protein
MYLLQMISYIPLAVVTDKNTRFTLPTHVFSALTLIPPGEVKVDLDGFDVKY